MQLFLHSLYTGKLANYIKFYFNFWSFKLHANIFASKVQLFLLF